MIIDTDDHRLRTSWFSIMETNLVWKRWHFRAKGLAVQLSEGAINLFWWRPKFHILFLHLEERKGAGVVLPNIARIANAVHCHNKLSGNKGCCEFRFWIVRIEIRFKCRKFPGVFFHLTKWQKQLYELWKLLSIVEIVTNVKWSELSEFVKIAQIVKNLSKTVKNRPNYHKLSKVVKIV